MTLQALCIPCQHGDHDKHQPVPQAGTPGLIGSRWECPCQGDCKPAVTAESPHETDVVELVGGSYLSFCSCGWERVESDDGGARDKAWAHRLKHKPAERSFMTEALAEFHGHPNSILDDKTNGIRLRRALLEEEFDELLKAIDEDDLAHIARELGDVLYVVFGTALVYGINLDEAFREIHRAAMDKMRAGLRREDGKILKPPGFVPPDMTKAIAGGGERS